MILRMRTKYWVRQSYGVPKVLARLNPNHSKNFVDCHRGLMRPGGRATANSVISQLMHYSPASYRTQSLPKDYDIEFIGSARESRADRKYYCYQSAKPMDGLSHRTGLRGVTMQNIFYATDMGPIEIESPSKSLLQDRTTGSWGFQSLAQHNTSC